ncbi:beta strand repeat-containing protein, partial [Singulisphaera rosea]
MQRRIPRKNAERLLKPGVEGVESRLLLSTFTVTNTNDDTSTGSLRWAIGQSNGTPGSNLIDFAIPGTGVQSIAITSALPKITVPVTIDGTSQSPTSITPMVELNGSGAGGGFGNGVDGLDISAGNSTVKGLVINRFTGEGIALSVAGKNTIEGNFIGTDPTGTVKEGNGQDGVLVLVNSNQNAILNNVISGNTQNGVYLNGQLFAASNPMTSGNVITGNFIGTDVTGTHVVGNDGAGVYVQNAPSTTLGGTTAETRNIISGNGSDGVELYDNSDSTVVEGNYIGTDVTGSLALGNGTFGSGIIFKGISNSTIGGNTPGAGNVLSGNNGYGIDCFVIGSSDLTVQGNFIGTDAGGTKPLGNQSAGVHIWGPSNVLIGGTDPGDANVISGNKGSGITTFADGPGLTIQGNFIGTDLSGTLNLGNGGDGVQATYDGITIGGTAPGAGNVIANNGYLAAFDHSGVVVTSKNTSVLSNSIYDNSDLGIELDNGNEGQAAPSLNSADSMGSVSTFTGTLTGAVGQYTLQFFSNPGLNASGHAEGKVYLGSATVAISGTSADFSVNIPSGFTPGDLITATATDALGNTSEFSEPLIGTGTGNGFGPPTIDVTASSSTVPAGLQVTDTFTISNPFTG